MNTTIAHSIYSESFKKVTAGVKIFATDMLSLLKLTTIISAFLAVQAYFFVPGFLN